MRRKDIAILVLISILSLTLTSGGYYLTYKIIKKIIHQTVKEECLNETTY